MAFEFKRAENSAAPIEKELLATKNEAYVHGEAVKFSSGKLTKASGTNKPEFIYVGKDVTPAVSGVKIAVVPVLPEYEWETTFSADASAVKAGAKVTIHTDGAQATATTTSGVFELLEDGKASGKKAVGRFA